MDPSVFSPVGTNPAANPEKKMPSTKYSFGLALAALIALHPGRANASESCPWPADGDLKVRTTGTTVTVNGETYYVRGRQNRSDFAEILDACDMDSAEQRFRSWRANRIAAAWLIPVDVLLLPIGVGLLLAPINPIAAAIYKKKMVEDIENRE